MPPSETGSEYMPQALRAMCGPCAEEFCFLTDRQSLTIVVARSVLGVIPEALAP